MRSRPPLTAPSHHPTDTRRADQVADRPSAKCSTSCSSSPLPTCATTPYLSPRVGASQAAMPLSLSPCSIVMHHPCHSFVGCRRRRAATKSCPKQAVAIHFLPPKEPRRGKRPTGHLWSNHHHYDLRLSSTFLYSPSTDVVDSGLCFCRRFPSARVCLHTDRHLQPTSDTTATFMRSPPAS
jgi:hypothetical protein